MEWANIIKGKQKREETMILPPRVYYPLDEVAGRWGCSAADIAAWSSKDMIELVTGIQPTQIGARMVAGFVVIAAPDILPMFRRTGTGPDRCAIRRLREFGDPEWLYIPIESPAIEVARADIIIMADEVARFEGECGFARRPIHAHAPSGTGAPQRYDWDGFYVTMIKRIHEQGVPARQADLVAEMQEWFVHNTHDGEPPEESTIRKRISPIWNALRDRG